MSKEKDGGRAFPSPYWDKDRMRYLDEGMSLRDYFAARAMQALFDSDAGHSPEECAMIAKESYEMADAMLRERDK